MSKHDHERSSSNAPNGWTALATEWIGFTIQTGVKAVTNPPEETVTKVLIEMIIYFTHKCSGHHLEPQAQSKKAFFHEWHTEYFSRGDVYLQSSFFPFVFQKTQHFLLIWSPFLRLVDPVHQMRLGNCFLRSQPTRFERRRHTNKHPKAYPCFWREGKHSKSHRVYKGL